MKDFIVENSVVLAWKFLAASYLLLSVLAPYLIKYNLVLDFLYFGLAGQILITLIEIQKATSDPNFKIRIRQNAFISTLVQWIIGPTLALLLTSAFSTSQYSTLSVITAVGIGAFWELAWKFIKNKTIDNFKNGKDSDLNNKLDEDRPNNGPR